MLRYLIPQGHTPFKAVLLHALQGALMAGIFGVVHDQITYTLGPSYFHKFKFEQFSWVQDWSPILLENHPRLHAGLIGILATWWVGMIIGWILGRVAHSRHPFQIAQKRVHKALLLTFAITIATGVAGYFIGILTDGSSSVKFWRSIVQDLSVDEAARFHTVGIIHTLGYIGAILGCISAIIYTHNKAKKDVADSEN